MDPRDPTLGGGERPPYGGPKPKKIDMLEEGQDRLVPLAYGRHAVAGSIIFEERGSMGGKKLFVALGEGEWDSIEALYISGFPYKVVSGTTIENEAGTVVGHFHPGLDGEDGVEATPTTRNQKFCSLLPTTFTPYLGFSRTAYLAMDLPKDPTTPSPDIQILGIYKCLRVRLFDNAATQTAYQYSTNPAWIALDLLIRRWIKPWTRINEALITAEKALVDFQAFKDWADACDVDIGGGIKRWEASVFIGQEESLLQTLTKVALLGRGYILERAGKIAPFHDAARSSQLTIGQDDILEGSLRLSRRAMRTLANRWRLTYRDLDSGVGPGTISSSGTSVTGVSTDFQRRFKQDELIQARSGSQAGEARIVNEDPASDTSILLKAAFSANQSAGTLYANPGRDFQERTREIEDVDLQDELDRIIEAPKIDLGNNTAERVDRLATYALGRAKRLKQFGALLHHSVPAALELLPGDRITAPAALDYSATEDYELEEVLLHPDGSIELSGEKYDAAIFTDTANPAQVIAASIPPTTPPSQAFGLRYRPTKNILKAVDAGSNVTIEVEDPDTGSSFTVRVGDADRTFTAGTIAALSFSTLYYVYCDDPRLRGGTPAAGYQATATKATAVNAEGRLFLGSIVTPADGGLDTYGANDGGGGIDLPFTEYLFPATESTSGTWTNAGSAIDRNEHTGRSHTSLAEGTPSLTVLDWDAAPAALALTLEVWTAIPSNTGPDPMVLEYSTNGGGAYTTIYSVSATRAKQKDTIKLSASQDLTALRVRLKSTGITATHTLTFLEARVHVDR